MVEMCGSCRHSGKIVGYVQYRRFGQSLPILYCEKQKRPVPEDYLCLSYESPSGKKLRGIK